ncbi:DNA-binding response OmpR family regulator [Stenotrophomonas rhizophila]|uniref:response regulator transcription factor n=1 Tax=Stenotrophomonas rhizophila TaxID=216778 RepID=UPI000F4B0BA1|nr:response regulator transcription factor [Stenotrophomonas rhizophila]ROP76961.1 DNA-binding response OmpR family regulator [Stenotrophomonas rhizophila]
MHDGLHILVIEDNPALRAGMATLLEARGHRVAFAADGLSGLQMALDEPPDVLVLDLTLPGMDGLGVCSHLRERADRHIPILMLTARDTLGDKLIGFQAGADDYLVKPFAGEELLARCLALAHRHERREGHVLRIGSLHIDRRRGSATRRSQVLELPQTAYRLLVLLAEASPRTVTRSELIRRLWGDEAPPSDPLRSHLYLLRQALDKPFDRPMLKTVHDVGFKLEADA